jgi:Amt family ammonium transporter
MFQLMFAIITPALIVGAIAERMKYTTLLIFIGCWMFLVYFPMAHMDWGITGFMNGIWNSSSTIKAIDFAGGTVVHMTSGWSALVLCLILGPRLGFKKEPMPPHSMVLCMVGTGMLWVGWYGFNAGSAVAADVIAANAFMTTTITTATASFTWGIIEKIFRGKASVLGFCSGAVAGLVVITPACGFVNATGAVILGVAAAVLPYLAVSKLKAAFGYDDALDTFGVHGIGGTTGALGTGLLATKAVNSNLKDELLTPLFLSQCAEVVVTLILSTVATAVIALVLRGLIGLRPSLDVETAGLDLSEHGEEAYID